MKPFFSFPKSLAALLASAAFISLPLPAQESHDHGKSPVPAATGQLVPVNDKTDAAWLAKAKTSYPLVNCVVSDEKLGGAMGKAQEYVYKQEGKPDRLVLFCCQDCVKDFQGSPAQYLKKIDEAAAAKAKDGPATKR